MTAKATAKYIRMSPRKVRLVVDLVRGKSIADARRELMFSKRAAAKPVLKVLESAIANAQNNQGADTSNYKVTTAFVSEGPTIKRFRPRAHGRAAAIRKRMSHITIEVGDKSGEAPAAPAAKEEKVEAKPKKKAPAKAKKAEVKDEASAEEAPKAEEAPMESAEEATQE